MDIGRVKEVGRIKRFYADSNMGVIEIDGGNRGIRFLKRDVRYEGIRPDDIVLFDLRFNPDGSPQAYNVLKTELQLEITNWEDIQRIRRTSKPILQKSAEDALREGNYGKARRKFYECIKHDIWDKKKPEESVFISYGDMEYKLGRYKESMAIYELGLFYRPGSAKLISRATKLNVREGKLDEALKRLTAFYNSYAPTDDSLRLQLVEILLRLSENDPAKYLSKAENETKRLRDETEKEKMIGWLEMIRDGSSRILWSLLKKAGFELVMCKVEHHHETPLFGYILARPDKEMGEKYGFNKQLFIYHSYTDSSSTDTISKGIELFNSYKAGKEEELHQKVFLAMVTEVDDVREFLKKLRENPEANPTVVPIPREGAEKGIEQDAREYIGQLFDEWLSQIDRYRENYPVQGRDFFGRERDLVALNKNIEEGKPTGIFGLRKVGKTSILYQLGYIRTKDLVAYIDAQAATVNDCKFIFWEAVNKWIQSDKALMGKKGTIQNVPKFKLSTENYASADRLPDFQQTLKFFDEDVRMMLASKPVTVKLLLFIDEIELVTPSADNRVGWVGTLEMFRYLRGTAQSTAKRFVPIIAGANPRICENPNWDNQDNPVFQFFEEIFIPLLPESECKELIVKIGELMNVAYEEDALEAIYKSVGGHPFFTRRLCSHIINLYSERPLQVTNEMIEVAQEEFMIKEDALFGEIVYRLRRDFPDELEILKWVARKGDLKELKQLINTWNSSIKHLEGYQLIERKRGRIPSLRITIELFEKWLQEA